MSFWIAIFSMSCWVVHGNLLLKYARQLDGISISFYRALSLVATMSPILFLADLNKIGLVYENIWLYFIGGVLGGFAVIFLFETQKHLPLGITIALDKGVVLVVTFLSFFIYGEILTFREGLGIFTILIGIISLVLVKNKMPHLDNNIGKGVLFMMPRVIGAGIWFFILGILSKNVDFAISAYLMEVFAFVGIVIFIGVKYLFKKKSEIKIIKPINLKDYSKIFLISSLSLGGSGGYALAVALGGAQGVISSILATDIIFISIMSYFLHNEKLNYKQWLFILVTFIGLIVIKL